MSDEIGATGVVVIDLRGEKLDQAQPLSIRSDQPDREPPSGVRRISYLPSNLGQRIHCARVESGKHCKFS